MAAVTVTGSIGGTPISFPTSTALQAALAQQIIAAATAATTTFAPAGTSTLSNATTIDLSTQGSVITGSASVLSGSVALDGQGGIFFSGTPGLPTTYTVVAADNSNSAIVNQNPTGALVGVTGAGGNVLINVAGQAAFTTGVGGQDIVILDGAVNTLGSNGSDAILVGGPSTITAASTAVDNILMGPGTTLNFINSSKTGTVDSIVGGANDSVVVAGPGSTSITAGTGSTFFVDTSVGNVTLNNALQTTNTIEFVKDANTATGTSVVNNFAAGTQIDIHNYASFSVGAAAGNAAGSVLTLSDGSSVTFSNVSAAVLQATVKVV